MFPEQNRRFIFRLEHTSKSLAPINCSSRTSVTTLVFITLIYLALVLVAENDHFHVMI